MTLPLRLLALVLGLWLVVPADGLTAGGNDPAPELTIRPADGGAYYVAAQFHVAAPVAVVHAVLTDYEGIPRFMPGVRTSRVLERESGRTRVAQEAVSRYMLFSKRVFLELDITEAPGVIQFTDRIGRSFTRYAGSWTVATADAGTMVGYELDAAPAFSVPAFVLRKLLDRDARAMIDGLRAEIATRVR